MAYDKFEKQSIRTGTAMIGVRPDGRLRLNSDASLQARDLGLKRVHLYWDKVRRRIALKRASDDDTTAYKLTYSTKQNSIDVGAKAFLRYIGLDVVEKIDLKLEWNIDQEMFECKVPRGIRQKDASSGT